MSSSISSSDPRGANAWAGFARWFFGSAFALGALIYLVVFIVDPFDTLPFSPPLDRVPIASNARFSFPALARSGEFDSAIIGTSTSRLLRPEKLNALFGEHFVNLSMNSATAYEQMRILEVFGRHHPNARTVIAGIDQVWCRPGETIEKYTPRPFPEWMYDTHPYNDFLYHFDLYTIEQTGRQLATLLGLRKIKYGRDGYTNFLPDPALYDLGRVQVALSAARASGLAEAEFPADRDPHELRYPALLMLQGALQTLSAETRKILYFAPYHHARQPAPGSQSAVEWDECKRRVGALAAAIPNTVAVDFMIESPFTTTDSNYWDPLHYSTAAAEVLMQDLWKAAQGQPGASFNRLGP